MFKVRMFALFKVYIFREEESFCGKIQTASAAGLAVRKFSQTNAPGSKRDTGVKQADALTRFGENKSSHAEQTQFAVGHAVAVPKKRKKALMWNLSQCFNLL